MHVLILAAGLGTRMGGRKVRLLVGGLPLLLAHIGAARAAGCARVLVVAHPDDEAWASTEAECVVSTEPEQSGSLALGVRRLEAPPDALVLITPVDTLPASPTTVARLTLALTGPVRAATPRSAGRGGHPVLLFSRVLDPYRHPPPCPPLREVLAALGPLRVRVDVDDPNVGIDLDEPADAARITGAPPRFFVG